MEGEMVIKSISGAICTCLVVLSFNVSALIIDNTSYTTDTDAKLDWLDLTDSRAFGKSYSEVLALTMYGRLVKLF